MDAETQFLVEKIKNLNKEKYLLTLMAKDKFRIPLLQIAFFELEISKIIFSTDNQLICLIKLQWWREKIDEIFASKFGIKEFPASFLQETIRNFNLPKEQFTNFINAQEQILTAEPEEFIEILSRAFFSINIISFQIEHGVERTNEHLKEITQISTVEAIIFFSKNSKKHYFSTIYSKLNEKSTNLINHAQENLNPFPEQQNLRRKARILQQKLLSPNQEISIFTLIKSLFF